MIRRKFVIQCRCGQQIELRFSPPLINPPSNNNKGEGGRGVLTDKRFKRPTPKEVTAYAASKGVVIDGEQFCDYYSSKGWMIGKNRMKDWRAAVRTWMHNQRTKRKFSKKPAASLLNGNCGKIRAKLEKAFKKITGTELDQGTGTDAANGIYAFFKNLPAKVQDQYRHNGGSLGVADEFVEYLQRTCDKWRRMPPGYLKPESPTWKKFAVWEQENIGFDFETGKELW